MSNVHTFTRAGVQLSVEIDRLSPEVQRLLMLHGLTQKIGDAAANAKVAAAEAEMPVAEMAEAMMMKVRDALYAGDWGVSRSGSGVSEETAIQRSVMRAALKEALGAKSPKWAEFSGLSDEMQAEKLDALFAKNAEKLAPRVSAEKKRREIVRKARENAKGISVEIDI